MGTSASRCAPPYVDLNHCGSEYVSAVLVAYPAPSICAKRRIWRHSLPTDVPCRAVGSMVCGVQFRGNGFLRKMVRHLVGAMIARGQHRISAEHIKRLLCEGMPEDLRKGGVRGWNTADACGLTKVDVEYPDDIRALFERPPDASAE